MYIGEYLKNGNSCDFESIIKARHTESALVGDVLNALEASETKTTAKEIIKNLIRYQIKRSLVLPDGL